MQKITPAIWLIGKQFFTFIYQAPSFNPVKVWNSGAGNWSGEYSKPVTGDFNGDLMEDVAVLYGYESTHQSRLWVFLSTGSGYSPPALWWDSGPNNWDWVGNTVMIADYNNDGKDEVIILYNYGGSHCALFVFS